MADGVRNRELPHTVQFSVGVSGGVGRVVHAGVGADERRRADHAGAGSADGTKIKAQAASDSFQSEAKIGEHLERARKRVREIGEPDPEPKPSRVEQARHRARRERQQRLEQGLEELQKLRPSKPWARVSVSEPEARRMRQADGGIAPNTTCKSRLTRRSR